MEPNFGSDLDAEFESLISGEDALRGWIPPDDRLWLHPSEIGRDSRMQELDGARKRARRSDRRGLFAAGVVGTAALTAAVAAVALAATSANPIAATPTADHPTQLTNVFSRSNNLSNQMGPATTHVCSQSMPKLTCQAVERVQPSMFKIVVQSGQKTTQGTAVVVDVDSETIAITAASLVGSGTSVTGFDDTGRTHTLRVLGVDTKSGVAVLKVPWAMPAAPIGQETLTPGLYVFACLGQSWDTPIPTAAEVGDPDSSNSDLMDAIDVDVTPGVTPGGVLLDSQGNMIGLLAATSVKSGDLTGEFVPAWLAVGVAEKIAKESRVVHGWLGVMGKTVAQGALVVATPPRGPAAAAGIKPGDLVVGLISAEGMDPILSMADLEGRLYLEPPGARVELQVIRGAREMMLSTVLTASMP
jgi:S1-C subfamily serine protease